MSGFPRHQRHAPWSKETVIGEFIAFHSRTGRAPTREDLLREPSLPGPAVMNRLFGYEALTAALDAAGLERAAPRPRKRRWTPETICERLRAFEGRVGRTPEYSDLKDRLSGLPGPSTVKDVFGSLEAARRAAGCSPGCEAKGTPHHERRRFAISSRAAELGLTAEKQISMAERIARSEQVDLQDALDGVQEGWLVYARKGQRLDPAGGDGFGYVYRCAQQSVRHAKRERARRASLDALVEEFGDRHATVTETSIIDTVHARMLLTDLLADGWRPGDDVLHRPADREREAIGLFGPIAQRVDLGRLANMPGGKWLDKLRTAHAAGRLPCICWTHVRELGITPPSGIAHRFPTCSGERPDSRTRRTTPRPMSTVLEAFLGELDARTEWPAMAAA